MSRWASVTFATGRFCFVRTLIKLFLGWKAIPLRRAWQSRNETLRNSHGESPYPLAPTGNFVVGNFAWETSAERWGDRSLPGMRRRRTVAAARQAGMRMLCVVRCIGGAALTSQFRVASARHNIAIQGIALRLEY